MSSFLQLAIILVAILLAAKLAGYLSTRLGQPSVLGELLIGLALGPSLFNITHLNFVTDLHLGEVITQFGEIGVLLLMFIAGLELHFSELAKNTKVSAYAGTLGVLLPVGLGFLAGELNGYSPASSIFLGLTLGATSVSISAQTLMEMGKLRTRVGLGLLGSAVFDDILVILLLSGFLALNEGGSAVQILYVLVRMVLFLSLSTVVGIWLLPLLVRQVSKMGISQGTLTFALITMLIFGIAAELFGGMAAITGTFLAGLMFSRTPEKSIFESGLRSIAYGLFVPIFFVNIGLSVDLRTLSISTIWLILAISLVAILGKMIGAGLGARFGGFSWKESAQLGVGMISRGEVGLIVGSTGLQLGFMNDQEFSAIIGVVLISTLVTPPLLRFAFTARKRMKPLEEAVYSSDAPHKEEVL